MIAAGSKGELQTFDWSLLCRLKMFFSKGKVFRCNQVPDAFHEPFITSGYRCPKSTAKQCLRSILEPNNETLNIWSHLLPFLYFCWLACSLWQTEENGDGLAYPMMCYLLCQCLYPAASCFAHIFNSMSVRARHICFFFDYCGISMFSMGSAIAYKAYVFPEGLMGSAYERHFLKIVAVGALSFTAAICHARFLKVGPLKKALRMLAPVITYISVVVPVVYKMMFCQPRECQKGGLYFHIRHFVFTFLAFVMYASHIPERFYPGRFDIIGQSHQFFHMFIIVASLDTTAGIVLDLQEKRRHLQDNAVTLPYQSVELIIAVGLINLLIVMLYVRKLDQIAIRNRSSKPELCQQDTMRECQSLQNGLPPKVHTTHSLGQINDSPTTRMRSAKNPLINEKQS